MKSFYEMQNFSDALRKMVEVTEKELLIVVRASKETGQTFKQVMDGLAKENIFPKPKPPKPALEEVLNCLEETGYPFEIELVEYPCRKYANNHFFLPETTKSAFVHLKKGGMENKELSLA